MEVPCSELTVLGGYVDTMFDPGANRSTDVAPKFEKLDTTPFCACAPTEMMFGRLYPLG
jgi:hypothetical protein